MKKKIILIIISVVFVFLVGLLLVMQKESNIIILKSEVFTYELGEDISADVSNYLKDADSTKNIKNYEILSEQLEIDNNSFIIKDMDIVGIGNYNVKIKYKNNSESFIIKVVDTTPPEFIEFKDTIEVEEGTENFDIKSYYKVEDLSEVKLEIEGNYDLTKIGNYQIRAIATDLSSNKSDKKTLIKVLKKEPVKEQNVNKSEVPPKNSQGNNNSNSISSNKPEPPAPSSPKYRNDIANIYVNQINEYRKSKGLSELPVTSEAQAEANRRSKELVTYYSHDGAGYGFGEIIGHGSVGSDFISGWKNSPSHNATILREQNTAIAASVYEHNNHWYAVISFRMDY